MSKFFTDQNPMPEFEEYLLKQTRRINLSNDPKEYESIKIYNFLEYNYFRLKKLAKLLHKKMYNLGSDVFFQEILNNYQESIKNEKKDITEFLMEKDHPFQERQKEIYHHFFTKK